MMNNNAKQQYLSSYCVGSCLAFLYADEEGDFYRKLPLYLNAFPHLTPTPKHTCTLWGWKGDFSFFKFHILQFVNLRHTACYFDIFISCNMISIRTIFIAAHYYRTGLSTVFMTLGTRLCGLFTAHYRLVPLNPISLILHSQPLVMSQMAQNWFVLLKKLSLLF